MNKVEMKPGIYWVGGIDWDIRNFHGYSTERGTTYNAYLIIDEKITLVDTVKHYLFEEMVERIKAVVDPSKIDVIISNHVEMDHSGSLEKIIKLCPNAKIYCSPMGQKGLNKHYKDLPELNVVKTGDTLSIGKRTLHFVQVPMIHWPDSMVTYIPEEKLLLPNDAFGQHIASSERFDDEIEWGILHEEAAKYYANIVMPFGDQVNGALETLGGLEIDMIGPSHGVIWRSRIPEMLEVYKKWATYGTDKKALIVYDTMWGSTEKIAFALAEGLEEGGVHTTMRNLSNSENSNVIKDVLTSKFIALGSPTLNNNILPTMGGFLTYLKGLRPRGRMGIAFGSYGWSGESIGDMRKVMDEMKWDVPMDCFKFQYRPTEEDLAKTKETGKQLAEKILND